MISKKLHLLLAFLFLIYFFSCKKEDGDYRLTGCVVDGKTGAPLSGAAAEVQKQVVSGGAFGGTYTTAASTTTDGSGNYQLQWQRENFAALKLKASRSQYITREAGLLVSDFEGGNLVEKNISIFPEAFIQVNVLNAGATDEEDQLNFTFTNAEFDCLCCSNGFKVFEGEDIDTTFTCKLYGDTWLKYQKHVYTIATDTIVNDSIWCPSFQTTTLSIQY